MELIAILLSSLLTLISSTGLLIDKAIANTLRSRLEEVEQLEVRVDNTPSYQILQGKINRIRIASRGVQPTPNLRIEVLEIETDPINIDLQNLRQKGISSFQESLREPVTAGVRLVLTEADINQALAAKAIQSRIEELLKKLSGSGSRSYEVVNPQIDLLGDDRLKIMVQLRRSQDAEPLNINLELGVKVVEGRTLDLINPVGTANGRALSSRLLNGFAERLSSRLDLRRLEKSGTMAKILQLDQDQDEIELAAIFSVANRTQPTVTQDK
ncbi:MAG: DUF2993 domain-containing protein [Gomphosphaeria aponina SAG 52.96 = DSM 107014]|uniref:DUF2993 domain-containing protein n=1 Tax=Gomphosphaeria aponina SAG 52.96 = DSM 107014 TaxID=1521640 RepID=A0A941GXB7_9CHRO|nr:DUF2993 domain-containing protein [Gomphosphaeria aponina SAG 52.96 = DSM 107014]